MKRDLVLNHASVAVTETDREQVASWLRGAIGGMGVWSTTVSSDPRHARYSRGGRIHFHFDAERRELEVGYTGPHLRQQDREPSLRVGGWAGASRTGGCEIPITER